MRSVVTRVILRKTVRLSDGSRMRMPSNGLCVRDDGHMIHATGISSHIVFGIHSARLIQSSDGVQGLASPMDKQQS